MAVLTSRFLTATTMARQGSTFAISNPSNALVSDDSRTGLVANTPPEDGYTTYLVLLGLATLPPMGSVIRGFAPFYEGQDTDAMARTVITLDSARAVWGGALRGSDISNSNQLVQGDDFAQDCGGVTQLLGTSWMVGNGSGVGDIASATFGFAFSFLIDQSGSGGDGIPAIDLGSVLIAYDPPWPQGAIELLLDPSSFM
jgi:hypothetical protein